MIRKSDWVGFYGCESCGQILTKSASEYPRDGQLDFDRSKVVYLLGSSCGTATVFCLDCFKKMRESGDIAFAGGKWWIAREDIF